MDKNLDQNIKVSIKSAYLIIVIVTLVTSFFVYGYYKINYCSDGDDFESAEVNELWGIVSGFDLLKSPGNFPNSVDLQEQTIVRIDTITQVVIIETNQPWKKIALLRNFKVDTSGWVNSKKIKCARNLTKYLQENFMKIDTTLVE